jgi:hypothetical protein
MTMVTMVTTMATIESLPCRSLLGRQHTMAGVSDDFRRVAYFYDCMAMIFYCYWINMKSRFLTTSLLFLVFFVCGFFFFFFFFFSADVGNFYYGQAHPMKPHRIRMTHNLLINYGLYEKMEIYVRLCKPMTIFLNFVYELSFFFFFFFFFFVAASALGQQTGNDEIP